ncbi:MAG: diversity-generating retroelement protein Avd [Gallionella sp.]|nr:diversity-generating retroelement protein Avd [Gallionella sp.]
MSRALKIDRTPKTSDLLIRQKVEAMIEYAYVAMRQFPKVERHVLSAEIRQTLWGILRLVIVCNKKYHKKTTLQELDAEVDLLRSQVRMAMAFQYLDFSKYEHWAMLNDEIGRMVGGWIKAMGEPVAGV